MRAAPRLISMSTGQHRPSDARQLVGQVQSPACCDAAVARPSRSTATGSALPHAGNSPTRCEPPAQTACAGRCCRVSRSCPGSCGRRLQLLLGHQPEPGAEVPPLLEPSACPNCRHDSRRDDRSHARHAHQALTVLVLRGERLNLGGDLWQCAHRAGASPPPDHR